MYKTLVISFISLLLLSLQPVNASEYQETVSDWKSYKDVGNWLENNFNFDKSRQKTIRKRLQQDGPSGLLVKNPEKLFENREGYCGDSAHFARETLNKINPEYKAAWIFIDNAKKGPNHWVTGFYVDNKLYVMDYGTGKKWEAMQGTHGPYDSLDEYKAFLASLDIPGFEVADVRWREMPGQED